MKNSRVLYIFLLALNFYQTSGTVQLDDFLKAVDDAHSELQWLDGISADGIHLLKRSASIGELLARFDLDDDDHELEDGDAWYQSFLAMECQHGGCQKKPLRWISKKAQPDDYYEYYDEAVDVKRFEELNDQREETANDLSHEVNYKLSKIEQDAMGKSLSDRVWPIYGNNDAVKHKTSLGMLKNDDGTSIPSADGGEIIIEDMLSNQKREDWVDHWKRREGRRLLFLEEDGEDPIDEVDPLGESYEKSEEQKEPLQKDESVLDLQQSANDDLMRIEAVQKTPLDRKLQSRLSANTHIDNQQNRKKNTLSDDLMLTDAFAELQNYLKENRDNKIMSSAQKPATVPPNMVEKDHDVNSKKQMCVNATVLGEDKLPEEVHRSNPITFKPPSEMSNKPKINEVEVAIGDAPNMGRRRETFPITTAAPTRGTNEEISKSVIEATENLPLDEIITGRLTSQLVKTVFELVKTSPSLKVLWPGLMRNKVPSPIEVQNFDAIRTQENESEMQRAEDMFRQAMDLINAIIEQQARSRSCVPLRSDLQAFYNLIIQSQAENERKSTTDPPLDMSDTEIRKKSKIITKLLRDYEELPREDQDQVASVKRNLLVAAEQLREMQKQSKRRKNQIMQSLFNDNHTSSAIEKRLSPEFVNLTKTAELLLHNSLKYPDFS